MFSSAIPWNILQVICIFSISSGKWDIPYNERALHNYYIPCHRKYSGQHNQCDIRVMLDGKVGCNTIQNTTGLAVSYLPRFYTLSAFIDQIWPISLRLTPIPREIFFQLSFFFLFSFRTVSVIDNMLFMMEKYTNNLEAIVNERTRQLQSEKYKTDELLHKMLPR